VRIGLLVLALLGVALLALIYFQDDSTRESKTCIWVDSCTVCALPTEEVATYICIHRKVEID
jgi:hypothetical protein